MIDHVTITVSNVEKSKAFYLEAFKSLNYPIAFGDEGRFWAFDLGNGFLFEICQQDSGRNMKTSAIHVAIRANSKELVHSFYQDALNAGATCNGPPGPRPHYTPEYYACFVLDPDGNNIEVMLK